MQGLSLNEDELYKVEQEIIDFSKTEEVQCLKVKGPSFEAPINHAKEYLQDTNWVKAPILENEEWV